MQKTPPNAIEILRSDSAALPIIRFINTAVVFMITALKLSGRAVTGIDYTVLQFHLERLKNTMADVQCQNGCN